MENKSLVYLREIDFTDLSYYKSKKYGISRAIYQYIGSTDETIGTRTSKWCNKNISRNNKIGQLLRVLMKMYKFENIRQLNRYLVEHTRILKEYDTIEQAKKLESTLITINMCEDEKYEWIICLNKRDAEVNIKEAKELITSLENKYVISKLKEKLEKEAQKN
ncbi:hypothetical protein [Romboutsia timonensis]|uniref:hypothetical protein n=1 Tax=Romboutsia timonensis TaxID=1776391 RepID=UPI0008D8D6E1|nr:hypothetical protein [Romboutsia timonensis]